MIPYIVVFCMSTYLAFLAEKNLNKDKKKVGIALLFLSILPLVTLAGLRTIDLGWDTERYGIRIFKSFSYIHSFNGFLEYLKVEPCEKGFVILMAIFDLIYDDINFVLFGLQFVVSLSFIIFAYEFRKKASITMMMIFYECTFYVVSFSTLRQSLAIAMSLLMIVFYNRKKYLALIITFLLALSFHNSAIFSLGVIGIMAFSKTNKIKPKGKVTFYIICIGVLAICALEYNNIIYLLSNWGILSSKYLMYMSEDSKFSHGKFESTTLIFKSAFIFLSIILFSISKDLIKSEGKWVVMLIIDYVFMFVSFKIVNIFRMTYYYFYPAIFILCPQFKMIFYKDKLNQILGSVIICLIPIIFFMVRLLSNYYDMYPYRWIL